MLNYDNPKLVIETAKLEPGSITWRSPSNLAIIKYWGKYGLQLPKNPSISFTLENAFTQTTLEYAPKVNLEQGIELEFFFHDEPNEAFQKKTTGFLERLSGIFPFLRQLKLTIRTQNSFPHSAGIASSASGMSALALCLCSLEDELFSSLNEDEAFDQKASFVARLGSGSACRSIFGTLAIWGESSDVEGSSNLFAIPYDEQIHDNFKSFHDDILIVSTGEKGVSSTAGHALMEENPFAQPRYLQARQRFSLLLTALQKGDLDAFGKVTENEALTLHALMMASNPSYILMRPNTLKLIELIRAYRRESKQPVYFSLDAGPNLHVLYPEGVIHEVRPFIESELVPFCEESLWLPDWIGEGPVQI